MTSVTLHSGSGRARRRSKRVVLSLPVQVRGLNRSNETFSESTKMLCVSAHGGLVVLSACVQKGQTILIINRATDEEQTVRVVFVGATHAGKCKVGFEFVCADTNFWRVHFPSATHKPLKSVEYAKVGV